MGVAKSGGRCIAHGGGPRCQVEGCNKGARGGGRCSAHGGGRRCQEDGCDKAPASGGRCIVHAGKKRNRSLIEGCELEVTRCVRFKSPSRDPNPKPSVLVPLYLQNPNRAPNTKPNVLVPIYLQTPRGTVMTNSIPEKHEFQDFPNFGSLFLVSSRF